MDLSAVPRDARVLFLGTGVPAAEATLALVSRGHRGKIVAISESGTLPSDLRPEVAASLHEIVAWHRLVLKAGRLLSQRSFRRGIRVEYFSHELGTPAKLECDFVLPLE